MREDRPEGVYGGTKPESIHGLPLSIFFPRREIALHILMQKRLVRVPAPATAVVDRDVLERIELEARKIFMPRLVASVLHLAVPKMINIAVHPTSGGADRLVKRFCPGQVPRSLPVVHALEIHPRVVTAVDGSGHGPVAVTDDTSVVETVLVQQ